MNGYRRIMVVADTHGDFGSLKKAYALCGPELIVHLGDGVEDALRLMRLFAFALEAVNGNNDPADAYPTHTTLTLAGHRLLLAHGHRHDESSLLDLAKKEKARTILRGHTHRPEDRTEKGVRILNPGALCFHLSGGSPSFIILKVEGKEVDAETVFL